MLIRGLLRDFLAYKGIRVHFMREQIEKTPQIPKSIIHSPVARIGFIVPIGICIGNCKMPLKDD